MKDVKSVGCLVIVIQIEFLFLSRSFVFVFYGFNLVRKKSFIQLLLLQISLERVKLFFCYSFKFIAGNRNL